MARLATIAVTGDSGAEYTFSVYNRRATFKELGAVYLMSKRALNAKGSGNHTWIYVGETGDLSDRPLNHHCKDCFDKHGANAVSILRESSRSRRLEIETDIRRALNPPCNRQ